MKKLIAAASLCVASFSVQAAITVPEYDVNAGKQIAESVCAACHGVDGVSVVPSQPNLGGQNVKYLYKQLVSFKAGHRVNGIMQSQVANLSQQDLANVAGYYAGQAPWGVGFGNPATTQEATKIFLGGDKTRGVIGCAGCHGPDAAGRGRGRGGGGGLLHFGHAAAGGVPHAEFHWRHERVRPATDHEVDRNAIEQGAQQFPGLRW